MTRKELILAIQKTLPHNSVIVGTSLFIDTNHGNVIELYPDTLSIHAERYKPIRGIHGLPVSVKTKREAVRLFEAYLGHPAG